MKWGGAIRLQTLFVNVLLMRLRDQFARTRDRLALPAVKRGPTKCKQNETEQGLVLLLV
jgi:hypothetical protein